MYGRNGIPVRSKTGHTDYSNSSSRSDPFHTSTYTTIHKYARILELVTLWSVVNAYKSSFALLCSIGTWSSVSPLINTKRCKATVIRYVPYTLMRLLGQYLVDSIFVGKNKTARYRNTFWIIWGNSSINCTLCSQIAKLLALQKWFYDQTEAVEEESGSLQYTALSKLDNPALLLSSFECIYAGNHCRTIKREFISLFFWRRMQKLKNYEEGLAASWMT